MKIYRVVSEYDDRTESLFSSFESEFYPYKEFTISIPLWRQKVLERKRMFFNLKGFKYLMISFYLINGKLKIEFNIFNG